MSGTIRHDASTATLTVEFPYSPTTKDLVKALPGARFDWDHKCWRFPEKYAAEVVARLVPRGFRLDGVPAHLSSAPSVPVAPEVEGRTVLELNLAVARALQASFQEPVWVVGEVAGFDRNRSRPWWFFQLIETDSTERTIAAVSVVVNQGQRERIEGRLRGADLTLQDGLKVRVRARVELYAPRGAYQLIIEDLDPTYSLGALALKRQRVLAELRAQGLAELNLRRALPAPCLRIALLTSAGSDAYHDFLTSLADSGFAFEVSVFDVRVQGPELEPTVRAALSAVARGRSRFDVVVLTRGGGSRVELGQWDSLEVATLVCRLPVKVLVAIGHQQDKGVLDEVATSVKTPTEAGAFLVRAAEEVWAALQDHAVELRTAADERVETEGAALRMLGRSIRDETMRAVGLERARLHREIPRLLTLGARGRLLAARRRLDNAAGALSPRAMSARLAIRHERLRMREELLRSRLAGRTLGESAALDFARQRLRRGAEVVARAESRLRLAEASVRAASLDHAFARGFALLRAPDGRVLMPGDTLRAGDRLTIETSAQRVQATITDTLPREEHGPQNPKD